MSIYTYNSHESMVPVHYRPMIASNHPSASRGKHPLRQVITADSQASFQTSSISPAPDVEDEAWHMLMARVERMKHAIATADSESDHLRSGTVTPSVVASRRPDIYGASSPNFANQSRPIDYRRPSATSQLPDYHCDVSETARRLQEFQFGPSPMATAAAVNTTNIATNPITPPKSMSGTHKPSGSLSGHSIRSAANSTRHMRNDSSKSSIYSSYKQPAILYSSYNGDDNNDNDDAGMESSLYYPPGRAQRRQSQYAIVPPSASSRALPRALPASSKHRMMRDRHGRLVLPPSSSHSRRVSSSSRRQLSISTITHTRNNSHYRLLRTLPLEVLRQVAEYLAADPSSTIVAFACVSRACYAAAVSDGGLRERVYRGRYLLHGSAGAGAGEVESDFLRWELRRMYGDQSNMLALNQTSPALTDKSNIYNVAANNMKTMDANNSSVSAPPASSSSSSALRKMTANKLITREQWIRQIDWTRVNRHRSRVERRWRNGNYTRRDVPLPGVYSGNGHEGHLVRVLAGCAWGAILETTHVNSVGNRERRVIVVENRPVIRAERDPHAGMTRIIHRVQPHAHELQVKATETGSGIGLTFTGVADVRLNDRFIVILAGFVSEFGTQRHALCVRSTSDLAGDSSLARVRVWMPPGRNLRLLSGRWLLVHRWAFDQNACSVYDLARGLRLVGQLKAPVRTSCLQTQDEHAAVMYLCEVQGPRQQLCWRQVVLKSDTNSGSGTSCTSLHNTNDNPEDASFSSSATVVNVASPTSSSSSIADAFNARSLDERSHSTTATSHNNSSSTDANDLSTLGQRQELQGELPIEGVDPQSLRVIPVDRNRVLLQYQLDNQDNLYQFALHETSTNRIVWQLTQPALAVRVHPLPSADRLLLLPYRQAASAITVRDADPNSLNGDMLDSDGDSTTTSEAGRMRLATQRCLVIRLSDGHLLHQRHWPWQITNSCSGLNAIDSTTDTQPDATRMAIGSIGCAANADGRWCRIDLKDGEPLGWLEDGFSVERVQRRAGDVGVGRRSPVASEADIGEGCVVTSTYFGYVERFTGLFVMLDFASNN